MSHTFSTPVGSEEGKRFAPGCNYARMPGSLAQGSKEQQGLLRTQSTGKAQEERGARAGLIQK